MSLKDRTDMVNAHLYIGHSGRKLSGLA